LRRFLVLLNIYVVITSLLIYFVFFTSIRRFLFIKLKLLTMWSSKTRRNRIKIDTINTFIQDRSLFELGTGTSLKSGGVKLAIWSKQIQNCRLDTHNTQIYDCMFTFPVGCRHINTNGGVNI
jgi:hypothetical protein